MQKGGEDTLHEAENTIFFSFFFVVTSHRHYHHHHQPSFAAEEGGGIEEKKGYLARTTAFATGSQARATRAAGDGARPSWG